MEDDTSIINWTLLYSVAIFLDTVGAILSVFAIGLIVNRIITLLAGPSFAIWFYLTGIKGWGWRLLLGSGSEAIPLIGDFLPLWTTTIWRIKKANSKTANEQEGNSSEIVNYQTQEQEA